jgi:hypothetical protein
MEELKEMTQDQQRGYLLAEQIYGLGKALVTGMEETAIFETTGNQLMLMAEMDKAFKQASILFKDTMTEDTEKFEAILQKAVGAPKALGYK